jgi:GTPase SAR1 family protein
MILIFGLPNSGKSTLATAIVRDLDLPEDKYFNNDRVRASYDDWDFSEDGRERQLNRAVQFASRGGTGVVDFVCPLERGRAMFTNTFKVWMNTANSDKYPDTTSIFEPPTEVDFTVDGDQWWRGTSDKTATEVIDQYTRWATTHMKDNSTGVYSKALSSSEISAIYNAEAPR